MHNLKLKFIIIGRNKKNLMCFKSAKIIQMKKQVFFSITTIAHSKQETLQTTQINQNTPPEKHKFTISRRNFQITSLNHIDQQHKPKLHRSNTNPAEIFFTKNTKV